MRHFCGRKNPAGAVCMRNDIPLNNINRNNNNRRRGRGNRNQGGGGGGSGGNQANRIDSRARGNAPQMLDKFKKLAQDAQHNGDRVQAEYYLQFADHYFRVIADNRFRQDEQRGRRDERDGEDADAEEEDDGEDRRRFQSRRERGPRQPVRDNAGETGRDWNREAGRDESGGVSALHEASEGPAIEPEDNPFARDLRESRSDSRPEPRQSRPDPRPDPRAANEEDRPRRRTPRARRPDSDDRGIDAAVLPPSISANDAGDAPRANDGEAAPRPRRKRSEGGTLSAVG